MMTKRHFNELADILGTALPELESRAFSNLCDRIMSMCEKDNNNFDRRRFNDALNTKAYLVSEGQ